MNRSESIKNIAPALLKAQKEMQSATKKSTNPFLKSMYAGYEDVLEACKKPLNENDIVILQPHNAERNVVETVLVHSSGEWISSETPILYEEQNPQKMGSAITYARRYGLQSIIALPAEDDDAESLQNRSMDQQKKKYTEDNRPWLTEEQKNTFLDRMSSGENVANELSGFRMKKIYRQELEKAYKQL